MRTESPSPCQRASFRRTRNVEAVGAGSVVGRPAGRSPDPLAFVALQSDATSRRPTQHEEDDRAAAASDQTGSLRAVAPAAAQRAVRHASRAGHGSDSYRGACSPGRRVPNGTSHLGVSPTAAAVTSGGRRRVHGPRRPLLGQRAWVPKPGIAVATALGRLHARALCSLGS